MRLPTLALLLFLLLAAPAAADSLVYAKDGNLWSARPDGSGQVQLTRDGSAVAPYESPSQADDGTIAAIRGTRLVTFDRTGAPRGSFGSVLTGKPGPIGAVGPFDARISPDGRTIGYWLGIMGGWYDYSTHTYYSDPESAVVFQRATDGGFVGDTMFHEEPSWTGDSSKVLLFEGMNGFAKQVSVGAPGANHNEMRGWFHDSDVFADPGGWKPIGAGELTRDGSRLAVLRAHDTVGHFGHQRAARNTIVIYSVNGFDKAPMPLPCWWINDNGYEMTPPQWSPDGRQFAWSSPEGIWVGTIGSTTSCDGW